MQQINASPLEPAIRRLEHFSVHVLPEGHFGIFKHESLIGRTPTLELALRAVLAAFGAEIDRSNAGACGMT